MGTLAETWLQKAQKNARALTMLGWVEVAAGILAILGPLVTGLAVAVVVGLMLLVGGGVRLVESFRADSFGAGALAFLWGLLLLVTGFHFVTQPGIGLASLTWVVALVLFGDGVMRVILAFHMKPVGGWGWMMAGGVLSVVLAVMIWRQIPESALWVIGTLIGISLISNGITTIFVAKAAGKVVGAVQGA